MGLVIPYSMKRILTLEKVIPYFMKNKFLLEWVSPYSMKCKFPVGWVSPYSMRCKFPVGWVSPYSKRSKLPRGRVSPYSKRSKTKFLFFLWCGGGMIQLKSVGWKFWYASEIFKLITLIQINGTFKWEKPLSCTRAAI